MADPEQLAPRWFVALLDCALDWNADGETRENIIEHSWRHHAKGNVERAHRNGAIQALASLAHDALVDMEGADAIVFEQAEYVHMVCMKRAQAIADGMPDDRWMLPEGHPVPTKRSPSGATDDP